MTKRLLALMLSIALLLSMCSALSEQTMDTAFDIEGAVWADSAEAAAEPLRAAVTNKVEIITAKPELGTVLPEGKTSVKIACEPRFAEEPDYFGAHFVNLAEEKDEEEEDELRGVTALALQLDTGLYLGIVSLPKDAQPGKWYIEFVLCDAEGDVTKYVDKSHYYTYAPAQEAAEENQAEEQFTETSAPQPDEQQPVAEENIEKAAVEPTKVALKAVTIFLDDREYVLVPELTPAEAVTAYTFVSAKPSVVEVDENGRLTPKALGSAKVTVTTANGKKAYCTVTVADPTKPASVAILGARDISIGKPGVEEDVLELTRVVSPDSAQVTTTWKTSSAKIAAIEQTAADSCLVKPVAEGTATITVTVATADNKTKKTASVKIKVVDLYKPTAVTLNYTGTVPLEMPDAGQEPQVLVLEPTLAPEEAYAEITYKSSSAKIATVGVTDGIVTPVGEGTATITATAVRGKTKKTATVKVKVTDPYKPTALKLNYTGTVQLKLPRIGQDVEPLELIPVLTPDTAVANVTYKTSSAKVATVGETDGLVYPVAEGTATITATAVRGSVKKTATVKVKVVDAYKPTAIAVKEGTAWTMKSNDSQTLHLDITPRNTDATFTWKSSKPEVLEVIGDDQSAQIIPHKAGSATITVTASRGGKKATFKVTVLDAAKVSPLKLKQTGTVTLKLRRSLKLLPICPEGVSADALTWKSSATKYATVDANGVVTPVAPGTATITVTAPNKQKASVKVKVVANNDTDTYIEGITGRTSYIKGETASFTVIADGLNLHYQWQTRMPDRDWIDVADNDSETYSCPVRMAHNGMEVRCIVTGDEGEPKTSEVKAITVESALTVSATQCNKTVLHDGDDAVFSVTANLANVSYQWQFREPGDDQWGYWDDATEPTISFVNIESVYNGSALRCIVTDDEGCSVTSEPYELTVYAAFAITAQPTDTHDREGKTVRFTVGAIGDALQYQWQQADLNGENWQPMDGKTASELTIEDISEASNTHKYRCVLTDASGMKLTTDAVVYTVDPTPTFDYETNDTGITLTSFNKTDTEVTVPAEIDGTPVTAIAVDVFANAVGTTICVPASVTNVADLQIDATSGILVYGEDGAYFGVLKYYGAQSRVVVPETVEGRAITSIGAGAFEASAMASIDLPDSVELIGARAFANSSLSNMN